MRAGILAAGLLLVAGCGGEDPSVSRLAVGQEAFLFKIPAGEGNVERDEGGLYLSGPKGMDGLVLEPIPYGTRMMVSNDESPDPKNWGHRDVTATIVGGKHDGEIVVVRRKNLRPVK